MRVVTSQWTRIAILGVVVTSVAATGCSSGWKMPTLKMPWSKKPSESALAGSGPSALTYPESPASKQTPSTIASAAAGKSTVPGAAALPANTLAQSATAKMGPPSYSAPMATTSAATPSGYKPPVSGAAAGMNGYATGPYNTSGQAAAPGSLAATAGAPARTASPPASPIASSTPGTANGYAPTNPYAPPPAITAGLPSSQAYGGGVYGARPSVAPAIAAAPSLSLPGSTPGTQPNLGQFNAPGMAPAPTNGYANAAPTANPANFPVNGGTYNPVGSAGTAVSAPMNYAQSAPANPAMNNGFALPNSQLASGPTNGMATVPAQTAAYSMSSPINTSTASYRPGSTARPTGYNFATQGNTPAATTPSYSNAPYTATGTSNPGYSLPPSSTLNR